MAEEDKDEGLLKEFSDRNDRVRSLYETAFSRPPTEFELNASLAFVGNQATLHNVSEDHEGRVRLLVGNVLRNGRMVGGAFRH